MPKRPIFVIYCLLLFCLPASVYSQFARTSDFANEQARRLHFEIDDWISYLTVNRFSNMVTSTNYLYIATRGGGILRFHLHKNQWEYPFTTSNGLPSNDIRRLIYDPSRSFLWAVTKNDVAVYNPASEEWTSRSQTPGWLYENPPDTVVNVYNERFFDRTSLNNLPAIFANGAYSIIDDWILLDPEGQRFPITGYLIDRYERLWLLVEGFGIGVANLASQRADFFPVGLPEISPRAMAYQEDDLWIGGVGDENVELAAIARWPFLDEDDAWEYFQARYISYMPSDRVSSIAVDGDSVWFGSDYGVMLFDRDENQWRNFGIREGLVSENVNQIRFFGDYLYVGTENGISRINLSGGGVARIRDGRFSELRFADLAAGDDYLWAATYRGIFRTDGNNWEAVETGAALSDIDLTAVDVYDGEGWFAGTSGIMRCILKDGKWESFPQVRMEVSGPYRDIQIGDKAVWIASNDGLLKFDRQRQQWRLFTERDGLLDSRIFQLLLDGDYIWIVSELGLTQFYWNSPNRFD